MPLESCKIPKLHKSIQSVRCETLETKEEERMSNMETSLLLLLALATGAWGALVKPEARIINGSQVDIVRHPYLVSLRYRETNTTGYLHKCAGVIYSERVVITAAQCLLDLTEDTKLMVVGAANTRNGTDGLIYPVANWTHHPQFDTIMVDYDIGLIFLDTAFDFSNPGLRIAELRAERPADGREGTVVGWGYREEGGPSSPHLEQVHVPIVSLEQCNQIYGVGEVTERMICAGDVAQGGRDACQGDTGGPLMIDGQLVGLVSWGRGCGRVGYPSVYTFVPSLKTWIDETIAAAGVIKTTLTAPMACADMPYH